MHWRYQGSRLEKELQFEIVEVEAPLVKYIPLYIEFDA